MVDGLVDHRRLPQAVWQAVCPMRSLQDPRVLPLIGQFTRWRTFGALPVSGGLDDQPEQTLQAFQILLQVTALTAPGENRP